ncbi:hypothetical protein [Methanoculleus sediminis]|uniref:hypothetical protein n=1 Tax=Methanoculleus sediminis TaxID=1550566 RepID=UPI000A545F5E|nr:hypothetical protein [Methanoculleus sediminis]
MDLLSELVVLIIYLVDIQIVILGANLSYNIFRLLVIVGDFILFLNFVMLCLYLHSVCTKYDWKTPPAPKPSKFQNFWDNVPSLIKKGRRILQFYLEYIIYLSIIDLYFMHRGYKRACYQLKKQDSEKYDAIIIVSDKCYKRSRMYGSIDLLIDFFSKNQISYQIFHVDLKEEVRAIISDPLAQSLWIFGHGDRGGVSCRDGFFEYSMVNIAHKKKYVYQFHCNGGTDEPLFSIISEGRGYSSNRVTDTFKNRRDVKQILQDEQWRI